jgi:hypothetical protein
MSAHVLIHISIAQLHFLRPVTRRWEQAERGYLGLAL